jgi:hypothetical protein
MIPGMEETPVRLPPDILFLLEATALANDCKSEEIVCAAIEAFLQSDEECQVED